MLQISIFFSPRGPTMVGRAAELLRRSQQPLHGCYSRYIAYTCGWLTNPSKKSEPPWLALPRGSDCFNVATVLLQCVATLLLKWCYTVATPPSSRCCYMCVAAPAGVRPPQLPYILPQGSAGGQNEVAENRGDSPQIPSDSLRFFLHLPKIHLPRRSRGTF